MADDVKLTKYIDGAGIKALYKSIREKVTGKTDAVTGTWTAAQATKAAQVSSSTTTDPYWLLGTTTQTNSDGTSLVKRADIKVTYEASGDACLNAPMFKGKFTGSFTGTAEKTTQVKSTVATGKYYLLGSTSSTESTDTPVKLSSVNVDASGNLTATKFIGNLQGNADSATNATNAAKVNVVNSTDSIQLLGAQGSGNVQIYRNSNISVQGSELILPADPTSLLAATTKQYVDNQIKDGIGSVIKLKGTYNADGFANNEGGNIIYTNASIGDAFLVNANGLTFAKGNYSANEQQVDQGDMIVCTLSGAITSVGSTDAVAEWTIIQRNIPEALTTKDITDLLSIADGEVK